MKIAFDITVLYVAGAGVYYYRYNLLRALLAFPPLHEFVLLDYFPVAGDWARNDLPEIDELVAGADTRRVKGFKHRKLARMGVVQKCGLKKAANLIDQFVNPFWRALLGFQMNRRLGERLADVHVFHSSEVLPFRLAHAANLTTIYDLTSVLFPEYHTVAVRELQLAKFHFAQTKADAVIAISESTKRDAVAHLGLDPTQVHVVYGGVDSSYRPLPVPVVTEALQPLGLAASGYILNVGTIEPRKNLVRLLQAYHRLRQVFRPTPRLVLVGIKGWMYDEVLKQAHTLELDDDVIFLGRVESGLLPALYNGARLFVYPSLYEGFGLPVLEAMACGTPVVTSCTSSLPEVAGDAALLVDPGDVAQIAAAMEEVLVDRDQATLLQQRGLERASLFTWEATAQKTLEVYESVRG